MLTKIQKVVANELYEGTFNEQEILERFKLSSVILQHWLGKEEFKQELERLREQARRQTQCTIARYAPTAALKLAELVGSEKPDVARRAALDLIDRCLKFITPNDPIRESDETEEDITDEQAREKLMTLAGGVESGNEESDK